MFSGLIRQVRLRLQARTGFDNAVLGFGIAAGAAAFAAFLFGSLTAFLWLAQIYDPLTAATVLTGFYLALLVLCLAVCLLRRRRNARQARMQIAASGDGGFGIDPRYLLLALQIGRTVGLRRILPIAAIGLLAAMGTREWLGDHSGRGQTAHGES